MSRAKKLVKKLMTKPAAESKETPKVETTVLKAEVPNPPLDPQNLFNDLMKNYNLNVDFDVIRGGTVVTTEFGLIKLEKDQLVLKATYAQR